MENKMPYEALEEIYCMILKENETIRKILDDLLETAGDLFYSCPLSPEDRGRQFADRFAIYTRKQLSKYARLDFDLDAIMEKELEKSK